MKAILVCIDMGLIGLPVAEVDALGIRQVRCRKPSLAVDQAQLDKAGILVGGDPEGLDEADSLDPIPLDLALHKADEQVDLAEVTKQVFLEGAHEVRVALGRRGQDILVLGRERLEHVDPDRANHRGAAQNDEDISAESAQHGGSRNCDRLLYRLSPDRASDGLWPPMDLSGFAGYPSDRGGKPRSSPS